MPHLASGEPQSYHLYTGNGVETDFTFAKGYNAKSHVHVTVDDVLQVEGADFNWHDEETIRFTLAPADGSDVLLGRHTPVESIIGATDGSVFDAKTLQRWYDQNLYWHQELQDQLDRTFKIHEKEFLGDQSIDVTLADQLVTTLQASDDPLALLMTRGVLKLTLSIVGGVMQGALTLTPTAPAPVIEGEECAT